MTLPSNHLLFLLAHTFLPTSVRIEAHSCSALGFVLTCPSQNGKELAAARQQALAKQLNEAAGTPSKGGRTPPASPSRAKAADFFFQ